MFEVLLLLENDIESNYNPVFTCESWNQLTEMVLFFYENGYEILIRNNQ